MTYGLEPTRLAARSEGKMPSPPGPVVDHNRSQTAGAPVSTAQTPGAPLARATAPPGGEGILPSLAPSGAHALPLRTNAPNGAYRGQDALAPKGPSLAATARRSPERPFLPHRLPAPPLQGPRPLGARASCPRSRRQARMPCGFEPTRLAARSEGKMPSPPGPVAGRGRLQTPTCLWEGSLWSWGANDTIVWGTV